MQVIQYQRRGGKTVWLVQQMRQDPNGILVCIHQSEIDRLLSDYPDIPVGRFITVEEITRGGLRGLRPMPNLYIDNLDMILHRWLGATVAAASITLQV